MQHEANLGRLPDRRVAACLVRSPGECMSERPSRRTVLGSITFHPTLRTRLPISVCVIFTGILAAWFLAWPAAALAQTVIGIASMGPHPALDISIAGFKEEMARQGYVEGRNTRYVYSDANFTQSLMPQMFVQIAAQRPALILTVTTPISQAALASVHDKSIPLVFSQVTDPVRAGLVQSWERGSARYAGASDLPDFDAVLAFARKLFPHARSFGTLYNPGESNDVVTNEKLQQAAARAGLKFNPVSVDTVGDIPQRAELLRGNDFVYTASSNLVLSALPAVASVTNRLRLPILSSETEAIRSGIAAANHAVSLKSVGASSARIAVRILQGTPPSRIPVARPLATDYVTSVSRLKFSQLGLSIPVSMVSCNCFTD